LLRHIKIFLRRHYADIYAATLRHADIAYWLSILIFFILFAAAITPPAAVYAIIAASSLLYFIRQPSP